MNRITEITYQEKIASLSLSLSLSTKATNKQGRNLPYDRRIEYESLIPLDDLEN